MQTLRLGIRPKTAEVSYRASLTLNFITDSCVLRDIETFSIPFLEFKKWRDKYSTGNLADYDICLSNRIGMIRRLNESELKNLWEYGIDTIFRGGGCDVNYIADLNSPPFNKIQINLQISGKGDWILPRDFLVNCIENPDTFEGTRFWSWVKLAGPRIYEALLDMVKKGYIDKKYYDRFRSKIM